MFKSLSSIPTVGTLKDHLWSFDYRNKKGLNKGFVAEDFLIDNSLESSGVYMEM